MRIVFIIFRQYPWQTVVMLSALLLSGIAEGIGISAMLPLLALVLGGMKAGSEAAVKKVTPAEKIIQDIFDAIGLTPTLELLLILILAAMLLKCALVWIANKRVGYTVAQLSTKLRLQMLRAYILARWEFFLSQPIGKLGAAMGGEANRTAKAYAAGVSIIVVVIHTMVYIGVAVLVSWKATLIALAVGTFFWYPLNRFVKKAKRAGRRQVKLKKSMASEFVDSMQSIKPLKAMAREDRSETVLIAKTKKLRNAMKKEIVSKQSLSAFQEAIKVTFMLGGVYVTIVIWNLAPTTVMVLIILLGRIMGKLSKIQKEYQQVGIFESGYWSMMETLEIARKMREPRLGDRKPELKQAIRLEGVTFAYTKTDVLKDTSLIFPAGEISAIVGRSGAGKTTIVDLVIGLLRPQEGEIWVDDLPLERIDLDRWRRMIGYVPQETLLLQDSIFMNVTLGDPDITKREAQEALQKAGIWEFVKAMRKGIRSTVGQRGLMLSGGQRQRIAIARALVRKPKLLILDEATTALDPENEAAISQTLQKLRGEITILAISHQPAVLEVADRGYRVKDGKVTPISVSLTPPNWMKLIRVPIRNPRQDLRSRKRCKGEWDLPQDKITNETKKVIRKIRLVAFDFDGVFTDNMVYVSEDGAEAVRCSRGDGIGLQKLRELGIETVIISTESNPVVSARARKLKIRCVQDCVDKRKQLEDIARETDISLAEVAFVGNDINDRSCLECVALPIVVADAHRDVIPLARYQTRNPGGYGAVREVCDLIEQTLAK